MNNIKRFFQEDIPATFSAGKLRITLIQLNSQLAQFEKQKEIILRELGTTAWDGRVKDARYDAIYGKLEELNVAIGQVQKEMDDTQDSIRQANNRLTEITGDFNKRSKEIQEQQRQPAMQKLGELQTQQKSVEQRLSQLRTTILQSTNNVRNMEAQASQLESSTLADRDAKIASLQSTISTLQSQIAQNASLADAAKGELDSNQAAQKPLKDQIAEYDQLIKTLQDQYRAAALPIQDQVKNLQQSLLKINEKKNGLNESMLALMPDLGRQVYQYRPSTNILSPVYEKSDAMDREIKAVNDRINLTNAGLASVGSRSVQKVAIAGGALVLLIICMIVVVAMAPMVATMFKPDPKASIQLVQSWSLANCVPAGSQGKYLDISVWENRRGDASANVSMETQLIGSNQVVLDSNSFQFDIGPGGSAVSFTGLDPQGSRVQNIKRSISSVYFNQFNLGRLPNVDVQTSFEKVPNSNNITVSLELTNKGDFGLAPDESSTANTPYALVIDDQNKLIDILGGALADQSIGIDSTSKVTFQSAGYNLSGTCLQSDYSQQQVTFWYFVPLQVSTSSSDKITISGKVRYTP